MLIFSEQDIIKDPPFSKIDLITCRNLLIYFGTEIQKRLMPLFRLALNPNGILFLGTSEGVGEFSELFTTLDRKAKLYQRKVDFIETQRTILKPVSPNVSGLNEVPLSVTLSLRELTEQSLLQHIAPAAALVNAQGDILYLHGHAGMYLEHTSGEPRVNNILKMAKEGLQADMTIALHKADGTGDVIYHPSLCVKTNGHFTQINLSVHPVRIGHTSQSDAKLFLIILEEVLFPKLPPPNTLQSEVNGGIDGRIEALNLQLRSKDEYIQSTREEMESANEELKSSNEELQSVNAELQSANEELEATKEEMHSANQELALLNTELSSKLIDLAHANNDMNNLLVGTGVATVFVNHHQHILRFTPSASLITNMILSDVGRPVAHIATNLVSYNNLSADTQAVLDTLIPKELEVRSKEGKWYMMRIQPYRTLDNVIEGAAISFVEITEMVHTREALHKAGELAHLAVVVHDALDAIAVHDLNGKMLVWNLSAEKMYGWSETEALAMSAAERIPADLRDDELAKIYRLTQADILQPYQTRRLTKGGIGVEVWLTATALLNHRGQMYAIATTERIRGGKLEAV